MLRLFQNDVGRMLAESLLPSSTSTRRLKQLKKILPSDRISIEKHFPLFYEKCKTLRLYSETNSQEVQDMRLHCENNKNSKNKNRNNRCVGNFGLKKQVNNPVNELNHKPICSMKTSSKTNTEESAQIPTREKLSDRFAEITMKRGCWLQVTYYHVVL